MKAIKHPDLPFSITEKGMLRTPTGSESPASPEAVLMGHVLMELKTLGEKLDQQSLSPAIKKTRISTIDE